MISASFHIFFFFSFSQHRAETKHMPKSQRWNGFGADSQMGTSAYYYNLLWLSFLVYRKKKKKEWVTLLFHSVDVWNGEIQSSVENGAWHLTSTQGRLAFILGDSYCQKLIVPDCILYYLFFYLYIYIYIYIYILFLTNLTGEVTWGALKRLRPKKWPPRIRV